MYINIFGSTGIIGSITLKIIREYFPEIKINLLTANNNYEKLLKQIKIYKPKYVYLNNEKKVKHLNKNINNKIKILNFEELISYLETSKSHLSILAISGYNSLNFLQPILKNTESLGLVSKEAIVSAGHLFKNIKKSVTSKIYPLDSEHFSIFQNFTNQNILKKLTLTASGGPFHGKKFNTLKDVSLSDATNHPKWKMGYKNSIDSATLVNKCLELIEAHYLFEIPFDKLNILIHPESIIHSIFEYDNYLYNLVAFHNDMTIPIFHFLNQSLNKNLNKNEFDFNTKNQLNFFEIKTKEFPIYKIYLNMDKSDPSNIIKFNVANEYAVNQFKKNCIKYTDILNIIDKITSLNLNYKLNNIKDILNYHELLENKINEIYKNS